MNNEVICPHCKNPVPLSEAFTHELREKYKKALLDERAKFARQITEEKEKIAKETENLVRKKLEEEITLKLKNSENESSELKKQNVALQEQLLELNKLLRQIRTEKDQVQLEMQKKLTQEEEKIRQNAKQKADDENKLRILEMGKKLSDALRANEDLNRKLTQGSQQLQGEVLELEIEKILKAEFSYDEIKGVGKGITGADIIQNVKDNNGKSCGTIIWETKRTKQWSNDWIPKLKDDQRRLHAEIAVLVSEALPTNVKHSSYKDGVWVTSFQYFTALAFALRQNLLSVSVIKNSQVGKNEKMEILYNYLYGTEFQHRVEAILEAFTSLQDDLEREKRWYTQKWAKQEKNYRQVIDNTVGMRGDVQSITGKALPTVEGVDLLEDGLNGDQTDEKETLF